MIKTLKDQYQILIDRWEKAINEGKYKDDVLELTKIALEKTKTKLSRIN